MLGFWIFQESMSALSALLGGMIAIVPNLVFLLWFSHAKKNNNAEKTLNAFYLAETLKILLTLMLFTLAFQWSRIQALPLFVTFVASQMAYWLFFRIKRVS